MVDGYEPGTATRWASATALELATGRIGRIISPPGLFIGSRLCIGVRCFLGERKTS